MVKGPAPLLGCLLERDPPSPGPLVTLERHRVSGMRGVSTGGTRAGGPGQRELQEPSRGPELGVALGMGRASRYEQGWYRLFFKKS